jgi:ubiquinone/menaquinone biosynthesis C-methylase UbiE
MVMQEQYVLTWKGNWHGIPGTKDRHGEEMLSNFGAYLKAGFLICLTSPVRLAKRIRRFQPPPFASSIETRILESDLRRKLWSVEEIIERSGIEKGVIVLELGCGPGVHTIDFAKAIGGKGKLYAVDMQPKMISRLKEKLSKPEYKYLSNIETKVANAYDLPFRNETIDLVVMVGVLGEIPDKNRALKEIRRVLKPGGILAISENLIDPDYPLRKTTSKYCEQGGYQLVKTNGSFFNYVSQFRRV